MKMFRYPMDPILTRHEWEIDALKLELLTLNQALDAHLAAMQALAAGIAAAEQEIIGICRDHALIARGRKEIAELYLRDQRLRAAEKQREIEQARALADHVFAQLNKKRQSQRVIEKHRERKKTEFDRQALRLEALENDELWLARLAAAV
jgi:flagellar biosynthesis chaperone FliJ